MPMTTDPMYALWKAYFQGPEYSKTPTLDGQPYDFSIDPLELYELQNIAQEEDEDGGTDTTGGNGISAGEGAERAGIEGGAIGERSMPYAWDPDYYHTSEWTPKFGIGDYLKEVGYGLGLAKTSKGLMSNILGLNPLANPLNDPINQKAISAMGAQYGFNPDMMTAAISNVFAGQPNATAYDPNAKSGGFLGGLVDSISPKGFMSSLLSGPTDAEVFASDTMRGMLGMQGDKWGGYNWDNYTQFDPTSPDRVSWGALDPHKANQYMDAWENRMGNTGSRMAFDADLANYTDLAKNEPYAGFRKQYLELIEQGKGPSVEGGGLTGHVNKEAYSSSGLKDLVDKPIDQWNPKDFEKTFSDYKDKKANPSKPSGDGDGGSNTNSGGNNRGSGAGASAGVGSNGRGKEGDYGFH